MENNIYEVERNDYVGFIGQIKKECKTVEVIGSGEPYTEINTYSLDKERLFARRCIWDTGEEKYYIFEMPEDSERCAPQVIRRITLETKEEVQQFFNVLAQLQNGEDLKND